MLKTLLQKTSSRKEIKDIKNEINRKCDVLEAIRVILSVWNKDGKQKLSKIASTDVMASMQTMQTHIL